MGKRLPAVLVLVLSLFTLLGTSCRREAGQGIEIITSDSLISGMVVALLPPGVAHVDAILPPGQCPGHYDVKLADIKRLKEAGLVVTSRSIPFMQKVEMDPSTSIILETDGQNMMVPGAYISGLNRLAEALSRRFPQYKEQIETRRESVTREISVRTGVLTDRIRRAGVQDLAVLASSMQRESLEWMGFTVVGNYGRPEGMSARELVLLTRMGREKKVCAVVDNLQSGPNTGKGIAETLGTPHVVLTNFPSEKGYLATLHENVESMLAAVGNN